VDPARPRGSRFGPFVVGVLVGLVAGVLLAWLGLVPGPLASGPAPQTKAAPPAAEGEKTAPASPGAETASEEPAKSAQPQAELACLQRQIGDSEGQAAVQQLAIAEKLKGAPGIESDPDYYIQVLKERGYSCDQAQIDRFAGRLEQKNAKR
jgi:ribosomal protein L12E/L44/L45/RPP1/RPP2